MASEAWKRTEWKRTATFGFTAVYGLVVVPFATDFVGNFVAEYGFGRNSAVLAALFGWALPALVFALQAVSVRLALAFWKARAFGPLALFIACQSLTTASVYYDARMEAWRNAPSLLESAQPDRKERERLEKVARSMDDIAEDLAREDEKIRQDQTLQASEKEKSLRAGQSLRTKFGDAAEYARQKAAAMTLAFAREPGGKPTDADPSLSAFMRRTSLTAPALFALLFALALPAAPLAFARAMVDKPTPKTPSAALDLRAEFAAGEALPPDAQPAFVDGLRPILASHLLSLWATKRAAAQTTYLHVEQQHELSILEEWADLRRRILESGLTDEARARLAAHADSVLAERLDAHEPSPQ